VRQPRLLCLLSIPTLGRCSGSRTTIDGAAPLGHCSFAGIGSSFDLFLTHAVPSVAPRFIFVPEGARGLIAVQNGVEQRGVRIVDRRLGLKFSWDWPYSLDPVSLRVHDVGQGVRDHEGHEGEDGGEETHFVVSLVESRWLVLRDPIVPQDECWEC
jgi:hypothetical protein